MSARRWFELFVFAVACLLFAGGWFFTSRAGEKIEPEPAESATFEFEPSAPEIENFEFEEAAQPGSYKNFSHAQPQHQRLPCLLCHKREDNSPKPRMTGHLPCAGCHEQQFAAGNQHPICQICHTATSVKPFPRLRSFNVRFDHARHRQTSCTTCHKPTRGGVGFSEPTGFNAHSTCYQCHTPQSKAGDRNLGSCGVCHEPGRPPRDSNFVKAYTVNFSHAAHTRAMNCATCHTIRAGMRRGQQVSAPLAAMHFAPARAQSCASCHNEKRAFGEDFNDCRRCHRGGSFRF
jgi:c(7)-type cytochrome triheme protein